MPAEPAASVLVPAGTTAGQAVREAGLAGKGPDAVVVVRDAEGRLRDLSWVPETDTAVEPIAACTDPGRSVIRHSCAHVLAQAVQDQFPDAKLGIGPPIADGFYYDFDVDRPFTPEDLEAIEERMHEIIREDQAFRRRELSKDEALELFADQPYKREIIAGVDESEGAGARTVSVYDNVRPDRSVWPDLCRGPHIPTTRW